jgi:hypothetical protein
MASSLLALFSQECGIVSSGMGSLQALGEYSEQEALGME